MRYAEMISLTGLEEIALYADGIGPWLGYVLDPVTMDETGLVGLAHGNGLQVHPWTLRKENGFLPAALQTSGDPAADGQYRLLWAKAIASGADGFFTDNVSEFIEVSGVE